MERIPSDPPIEIDVHIFDRLVGAGLFVGRIIRRCVSFLPPNAPDYVSDHYRAPGDSIKATAQKEWQMAFDLQHDVDVQLHEDGGRWTDMGEYLERE